MSAKPTRSELESALAGRAKPDKRSKARATKSVELQLDSMTARRQKVIGGDLTGVSKRQKNQRFGRGGEINYINWIAGGIVLLIIAVFFWPQSSSDLTKEVAEINNKVDAASFYTESRVDEVESAPASDQSFIRTTDIERAAEFREQEELDKQVASLFSKADAHVAKGQYTQPADDNALTAYRKVLELVPNNFQARQGIEYINGRFLSTGILALENNNEQQATSALAKLNEINPESDEALELSATLTSWRQQRQIRSLLNQAQQATQNERLILPARNNALFFYQQILEIDPENEAAARGTQSIADSYIRKANEAIFAGQYEAATGYLATVSVIDAKHESIPLIEEMIAKGAPLNAQRNARQASLNNQQRSTQNNSGIESRNTRNNSTNIPTTGTNTRPLPTGSRNGISADKTPPKEAGEQEAFDRQYLERGLDAYYKGEYETAAALLQPLADKGVSRAQFRIGYMYYLGRGFPRNRTEADRVIRAALPAIQEFANEGRGWAQSDLGSLYEDGLVLPRDYAEAVYWYRSAAEQGYPGAQTNLGIMYARGRGVTSSRRTAIEWFQRAAKQGDISAQRNLETMGINP